MMWNSSLTQYISELSRLMQTTSGTDGSGVPLHINSAADHVVNMIVEINRKSKKVLLIGNGGSAAIVSHVQNDLCKAVGVRAMVFTEQPLLTAYSNDYGYESAYDKPTQLWADEGDLMIAVSSSGQSQNILSAVKTARAKGCTIVTFSGFEHDNSLRTLGDINFHVDSQNYGFVETCHAGLTHCITDKAMALLAQ